MERMKGFKCKTCGMVMCPRHARCLNCKGRTFEEIELGDECTLLTYTKLYAYPEGIELEYVWERPPIMFGIVEFKGGVRVVGQLTSENVKIGMKMRPVWGWLRRVGEDDVHGFKFEPIK